MILTDNETKVDLLNNEAIAQTIINLLRTRPEQPVTLGVHGDWGAGKSSVLEMIEAGLDQHPGAFCLKFNGWRFQGFEDAKIALIEGIVTGLIKKQPKLTKAAKAVKDIFQRIDWLKVAKKAGGLAFTAFTGIPTLDQIHTIIGSLEGLLADPAQLKEKVKLESVLEGVKGLLKPAGESKSVPEEIGEFRKAFDQLLKDAGVDQLIVLIDDLDRCLPETAIETLEAVRLFVFTARTAFVVAADEAMIEYAVRKHFPELPDTTGPRDYARNYLEKLIQVPFRIPALGETETRIYVTLLLVGAELADDDDDFKTLIRAAREALKRPWKVGALDAATVKGALGTKGPKADNALTLSDQIGPILAKGTKGNPRQIKRFLNTMLLRQLTADARGFGDEVKRPILAKLMLAERFMPRLFEQIASSAAAHPKGWCDELGALETEAAAELHPATPTTKTPKGKTADEEKESPKTEPAKQSAESVLLSEWMATPQVRAWARVKPALASVDLRPYLFVSKDRKDHFGPTSTLGRLTNVVEQLLGPKLLVQGMESDLRQLLPSEAAQVFEGVRERIMGSDSFDQQPHGAEGLAVLVKVHPSLQANLLDFLEGLPRDRLGAWPVQGWVGALKDPEVVARFDGLVDSWATSPKSAQILKTVASAAQKTRRGPR